MSDLLTKEALLNEINGQKNNVLLGNGFSISFENANFLQSEILSEMDCLGGKKITDIEDCINATNDLIRENENTVPSVTLYKWIKSNLHKEFITTLFAKMPPSIQSQKYDKDKLVPYKEFFKYFNNFFTLNYDPLLYWMCLQFSPRGHKEVTSIYKAQQELENISIEDPQYEVKTKVIDKGLKKIGSDRFCDAINKEDYSLEIYLRSQCIFNKKFSEKSILTKDAVIKNVYEVIQDNKKEFTECEREVLALETDKEMFIKEEKEKIIEKEMDSIDSNDGFFPNDKKVFTWNKKNPQNVYYLHGAFHILEKDDEVIKITKEEKSEDNISTKMLGNIQNYWKDGFDSLTILEGNHVDKKREIEKSNYLTYCYEQLCSLSGDLVTFGVSFFKSDNHIIEAINKNTNIKKVYIGCHGVRIADEILNKFSKDKKLILFDTINFFEPEINQSIQKQDFLLTSK